MAAKVNGVPSSGLASRILFGHLCGMLASIVSSCLSLVSLTSRMNGRDHPHPTGGNSEHSSSLQGILKPHYLRKSYIEFLNSILGYR